MKTAIDLLKAAATTAPKHEGNNPVANFLKRIEKQITYVQEVAAGAEYSSRVAWFKNNGNEYVVQVGRNALEIAGSKYFRASDLEGVVAILKAVSEAIAADAQLQKAIKETSQVRSERLKVSRSKPKVDATATK